MDTVKEVNLKENDFLYDIINTYLHDPDYKWAAELFDEKYTVTEEPSQLLRDLNSKLDLFDELKYLYYRRSLIESSYDSDRNYIETLENRSLHDFSDIKSINQFNIKVKRDLLIIDYLHE